MGFGVDTLRAGGMVSGVDSGAEGWRFTGEVGPDGLWMVRSRSREISPGVTLSVVPGREVLTGWVEGSAPRSATGFNFPALCADDAVEVARGWLQDCERFVTWEEPARLNRADVVADLMVGDRVAEVLGAVGGFRQGGRATRALYADATANHAMTVWARTRRCGGGRLYDKFGESGQDAARGIVRFEGQERTATLRPAGVLALATLDGEVVERLARARFDWAGFGDRALPREDWVARIMAQPWQLDTRFYTMGWALAGFPHMPENRQREWRTLARMRSVGQLAEVSSAWRLDLSAGLVAA
jgi:hypothetical protein